MGEWNTEVTGDWNTWLWKWVIRNKYYNLVLIKIKNVKWPNEVRFWNLTYIYIYIYDLGEIVIISNLDWFKCSGCGCGCESFMIGKPADTIAVK